MPATATLPDDFADVPYEGLGITIAGVGATMGSTLAVETEEPIRKHERAYVLLYTECQKISFPDDKDGNQIRVAHLHPEDAYWVDPKRAEELVAEQRAERRKREDDAKGQTSIDDELDAQEREGRDETDSPNEIAAAAAKRAKGGQS